MRKIYLAVAFMFIFGLISCAQPVKRSSGFLPEGGMIQSVEIILEEPGFVVIGGGLEALASEGWLDGSLEFKFCNDLVMRLKEAKIAGRCERSMWGRRITFVKDTSTVTHVLSIRPMRLYWLVQSRYGVVIGPGRNPGMNTVTRITNKANGALAWEGDVDISFAPVDQTGARRYAESLIEALQRDRAIASK